MCDRIDIKSFCKILTDLTNKDKCSWRPTLHASRDRLDFKTGYIEITLYQEKEQMNKYYCIDFYDNEDCQYLPVRAYKGIDNENFIVFGDLYKAIWDYYIRTRNKKMNSFLIEILEQSSKK